MSSTAYVGRMISSPHFQAAREWVRGQGFDPIHVRDVTHQPATRTTPELLIFWRYRRDAEGGAYLVDDSGARVRPHFSDVSYAVGLQVQAVRFDGNLPYWWDEVAVENL